MIALPSVCSLFVFCCGLFDDWFVPLPVDSFRCVLLVACELLFLVLCLFVEVCNSRNVV